MIGPWSWKKQMDFCCCRSLYIYRFYNTYFIFSSFLYFLYSQLFLHFQVLSSFCIFRVFLDYIFCKIQNTLFLGARLSIIPKMSFFFFKKSVNVLPLGHFNFMWNFRKKSYEAFWRKTIYLLKYWHSDQLTHWQRWFHRIAFCLKAGVTKSNLEVQQFVRYISFKSLFGHALVGLNMPI